MTYHVVQCPRCSRRLHPVPADALDIACPDCSLKAPVEAFRWVGTDLDEASAHRLAGEWNPRLVRGLTENEAREFESLTA
ncbi:MAG TPA: hypothetical protein VI796_07020 [Candidatus Thermoplasmatota archaeon]|nr:hypothetical protein [Candidatus Thermoplasmatota archaeon]